MAEEAAVVPLNRSIGDYLAPTSFDPISPIVLPNITARNFELKPQLLSWIEKKCFRGARGEDPNNHLNVFLRDCSTVTIDEGLTRGD